MGWLDPNELPYQNESETSKAAAERAAANAETLRGQVLRHLKQCGVRGATDSELQEALNLHVSTQVPRRRELVLAGKVMESGFHRKTHTGNNAIVWIASEVAAANPEAAAGNKKSLRLKLEDARRDISLLRAEIEELQTRCIIRVPEGNYARGTCCAEFPHTELRYFSAGNLCCPACGSSTVSGIAAIIEE